jgi:hypothetical protein
MAWIDETKISTEVLWRNVLDCDHVMDLYKIKTNQRK